MKLKQLLFIPFLVFFAGCSAGVNVAESGITVNLINQTIVEGVTGNGTTNTIPKWTGNESLGDSIITESGDTITISDNLIVNTEIETPSIIGGTASTDDLYLNPNPNSDLTTGEIILDGTTSLFPNIGDRFIDNFGNNALLDFTPSYSTSPFTTFGIDFKGFDFSPTVVVDVFVFGHTAVKGAPIFNQITNAAFSAFVLFSGSPTFNILNASSVPMNSNTFRASPSFIYSATGQTGSSYSPINYMSLMNMRAINGAKWLSTGGSSIGFASQGTIGNDANPNSEVYQNEFSHFKIFSVSATGNSYLNTEIGLSIPIVNQQIRKNQTIGIKSLWDGTDFIKHTGDAPSTFGGNITLIDGRSLCFNDASSCIYQNGDILNITSPYVYGQNSSWSDVYTRTEGYDENKYGDVADQFVDMTKVYDINGKPNHILMSEVGRLVRPIKIQIGETKITHDIYSCNKFLTQKNITDFNLNSSEVQRINEMQKTNKYEFKTNQTDMDCDYQPYYSYDPIYRYTNITEHSSDEVMAKHEQGLFKFYDNADIYKDVTGRGVLETQGIIITEDLVFASPKELSNIDKNKVKQSMTKADREEKRNKRYKNNGDMNHAEWDEHIKITKEKVMKNKFTGQTYNLTIDIETISMGEYMQNNEEWKYNFLNALCSKNKYAKDFPEFC